MGLLACRSRSYYVFIYFAPLAVIAQSQAIINILLLCFVIYHLKKIPLLVTGKLGLCMTSVLVWIVVVVKLQYLYPTAVRKKKIRK